VGTFRLSRLAEADLLNIGIYTLHTWGEAQTIRYIDELEDCCQRLADSPTSGRPCDHIRPGLYRREVRKHVIFFRREPAGILVSRILHERMLPEKHAFNDEDETGSD
jgi:toxin ParE1/3/4